MPEFTIIFQEVCTYQAQVTAKNEEEAHDLFYSDNVYYADKDLIESDVENVEITTISTTRRTPSTPDTTNSTIIHPKPCP